MTETESTTSSKRSAVRIFFGGFATVLRWLRVSVANVLVILLLVAIVVGIASMPEPPVVQANSILVIDPDGELVEAPPPDPTIVEQFFDVEVAQVVQVSTLRESILTAKDDARIAGAILDTDELGAASLVQLLEIGSALREFQESGKEIWAYGTGFSQGQYLLASYADEVYMDAMGELLFPGMAVSNTYFKGLVDKLDIKVHAFHVGAYKSAIEPFIRTNMSEDAREANVHLVTQLWSAYAETVAANRELSAEDFASYSQSPADVLDKHDGSISELAVSLGFVDQLEAWQDFNEQINSHFRGPNGSPSRISYDDYHTSVHVPEIASINKIAVIVAEGPIVREGAFPYMVGSLALTKLLRRVERSSSFRGLVLRIDSPGGGVYASEEIRLALERISDKGKPVVASMAGTAASGGYWIAAPADRILASPLTITGSIGVFGVVPTFEDALANIGVTSDSVTVTPLGDALSYTHDLPEQYARILQASVEGVYSQFKRIVQKSRPAIEDVEAVAQGRVWLGSDALEFGLIDAYGDVEDAIALAAELAGLDRYRTEYLDYPREYGFGPFALAQLIGNVTPIAGSRLYRELAAISQVGTVFQDTRRTYVLCFTCIARML